MKTPGSKLYGLLRRRDAKVLREYYSGVPLSDIRRRYGITESRLKGLSSSYMNGEIETRRRSDSWRIKSVGLKNP